MSKPEPVDYYEVLQINPNAEPETIQRVYRLLARRYHPDNQDTGHPERFRLVTEAYRVLSDPEARASYDAGYQRQNEARWRLASARGPTESDFQDEQRIRAAVVEVLFTRRRMDPSNPGLFPGELEKILGTPREHLEFTIWYLLQKRLVTRTDNSRLAVTAEGVDYLEQRAESSPQRPLRLRAAGER